MEVIIVLIIIALCWKVGVIGSVKETVTMANNEVSIQAATHKTSVVKRAAELESLDTKTVEQAKANIAALKSFNL